jgi:ATP-dependent protease ClpP protease subunit
MKILPAIILIAITACACPSHKPDLVLPVDENIVLIDGKQKNTKIAYLDFEINDQTAAPLISALRNAPAGQTIIVIFNTVGGELKPGFDVASAMRHSKATVLCDVDAEAYSMGAVILQSCAMRSIRPWGTLMIHRVATGATGNSEELKDAADALEMLDSSCVAALTQRSKLTPDKIRQMTAHSRLWYISAEEALKLGLVDVVTP